MRLTTSLASLSFVLVGLACASCASTSENDDSVPDAAPPAVDAGPAPTNCAPAQCLAVCHDAKNAHFWPQAHPDWRYPTQAQAEAADCFQPYCQNRIECAALSLGECASVGANLCDHTASYCCLVLDGVDPTRCAESDDAIDAPNDASDCVAQGHFWITGVCYLAFDLCTGDSQASCTGSSCEWIEVPPSDFGLDAGKVDGEAASDASRLVDSASHD